MPLPPTAFVLTTAISLVPSRKLKRRKKRRKKSAVAEEPPLTFKRQTTLTHIVPLAPRIAEAATLDGFDPSVPQFRMPWPQQCKVYLRVCLLLIGQDGVDVSTEVREKLSGIYPQYDWEKPESEMGEDQSALFRDALVIGDLAKRSMPSKTKARDKIRVGKKRYLARPHIQDASIDLAQLRLDDVVECIAAAKNPGDDERIYAKVTKLTGPNGEPDRFEVLLIGSYAGRDVAPCRTQSHGFRFDIADEMQSSRMFLSRDENSGVVRLLSCGNSEPVDVSQRTRENRG